MVVCKFFQQGYCRFGQSCRFEHEFGSKYSYRAPQTQKNETYSSSAALFRNAAQQNATVFSNAGTSVFAPVPQQRSVFDRLGESQPTSVFNRIGEVQPKSVFDRLGDNKAKSVFAQANQSIQNQAFRPSNPFQTNQYTAPSVFSSPNPVQVNQNNAASIFASAAQRIPQKDTFMPQSSGNVFQISEQPKTNVFGVTSFNEQNVNDDGIYSKIEDLSPSDIEAFQCSDFKLGFIPEVPPPKSLCV